MGRILGFDTSETYTRATVDKPANRLFFLLCSAAPSHGLQL